MSGTPVPPGKTCARKLVVLMVTAFMNMVGVLMIVPLMPFYAKHMGAGGFGPLVAVVALRWGPSGPGWFAATLSVLNIAFAWKFLTEARDMTEAAAARSQPRVRGRSIKAVARVATHPNEPASRLVWIYA